ncbi:rhodanese-like domain-containing protein [uncultured Dysosmobacter sp.]|uniref:rhodanese-like domain-containing protein n=1 Tax=uncultured Dysosmobacter sp. TaxID=2591384 RepID=UPI002625C984|nr:rhodanese-like domain-containing protein [uncultured Dysosmobacter sp.]
MKQFFLLAAVICFGVALLKFYTSRMTPNSAGTEATGRDGGSRLLSPEEAKARLDANEAAILLDVRTQEEFDGGHIPGAVCLPNELITADMPVAFDKDAEILVYCRSGRRSAEAAQKLTDMGYTNVADFGGILDWPYETTTE